MDNDSYVVQQVASGRLKGIRLSILSDEDAEKLSATVIGTVNEVSGAALGVSGTNATECLTCGGKSSKDCEGHFGLINLPYTILNPYFMPEIAQILNRICPGCKSLRRKESKRGTSRSNQEPKSCRYCVGNLKAGYPRMTFKVSSKDVFAKSAIIVEAAVTEESSERSLAPDYWDIIPKDSLREHSGLPSNKRVLLPSQVYYIFKDVCPTTLETLIGQKGKIFLNSLLVTPNSHRVREFGQRITIDETTKMYRKLIDFRGTPNELSARVIDRFRVSKIRPEKLTSIQKVYEAQSQNESVSSASGLKNLKDLVLGKRTDSCFRMVVVGDPRIMANEIGVPFQIAANVLVSDHINSWNWKKLEACCDFMLYQKGYFSVLRKGERIRIWSKDMLLTGDSICRPLIDGDIVLINRPPSIHQHSLIALRVKALPLGSTLAINPLICSPLRGDFDGDCLHGYVPQSICTRVELSELISLNKQLINGQSGQNLLTLTQDSLTAAYLFLKDDVILGRTQMQQLQMFSSFMPKLPAIIQPQFWTGKQLFSLLLPPDFEYDNASNGVYIRQGELVSSPHGSSWLNDSCENLFQCLIRRYGDRALNFFNAAQDALCEWLMMRGLSVSLFDLYLSSSLESRKNLLDDIFYALQEADDLSDISLLMVDGYKDFLVGSGEEDEKEEIFHKEDMSIARQISAELFHASISACKSVLRDMQTLVYKYACSNNSLIAMLNAGSKGNLVKLVQHSMCLGLQHTLAPLSFSIPRYLSCASWNYEKESADVQVLRGSLGSHDTYIPSNVVANSFLSGLNPLELFVLSLTTRDSSFSGHADVSGTLTRKLMFFMRDLIIGYDGTVRSNYGNRIIQFDYWMAERSATHGDTAVGGHPVGSLAACAISEAAYSALDQPVSVLEPSPLLTLKTVLECGVKKSSGKRTVSLYLSKTLGKLRNGFEYGALDVKNHLESVLFSDIVSEVRICYLRQGSTKSDPSPWACHFHISKDVAKKRRLKMGSVVNSLYENSSFAGLKLKTHRLLRITHGICCEAVIREPDSMICISAGLTHHCDGLSDFDFLRERVVPILLQTVIKGCPEISKIDILWKDEPNSQKHRHQPSGELFLRVAMSKHCDGLRFWSAVKERCLRIWDLIDWQRSHPDNIRDCSDEYGISVGWQLFVNSLHSAISDTGKTILPEHLLVTANCLSATGEFLPLHDKGLAKQRKETDTYSPFSHACFSNPSDVLAKAAKSGQMEALQGSAEALAWGLTPSIGTGAQFDIMYNGKGHKPSKPADVYSLLHSHVESPKLNAPAKPLTGMCEFNKNGHKSMVSQHFSEIGLQKLSQRLKRMLKEYPLNRVLSGEDRALAMKALRSHPRWEEKTGPGVSDIKVGRHPRHGETCFFLLRTDGTEEDISYHKCIHHALGIITRDKGKGKGKGKACHRPGKRDATHNPTTKLG